MKFNRPAASGARKPASASMPTALAAALLALGLHAPAFAHVAGTAHHWWSFDPWVWLPLLLFTGLYLRGMRRLRDSASAHGRRPRVLRAPAVFAFVAGIAALFIALIWPLDALGTGSFAAHMAQHMLLIAVAAPLLVYAEPSVALQRALPAMRGLARSWPVKSLRRVMLAPRVAFALHAVLIWIWHAPLPFELALRHEAVHVLEHVSFLGSAILFWTALRQTGRAGGSGYGAAALWTLGTLMHTGLLGALITFAPRLLYAEYATPGMTGLTGLTALEDQQLAGLIMWIPGGVLYLVIGLGFAAAWLQDSARHPPRWSGASGNDG